MRLNVLSIDTTVDADIKQVQSSLKLFLEHAITRMLLKQERKNE